MISSQILFGNGDHKINRMKTIDKNLIEEFFFHAHPFSDLILLVQGIGFLQYKIWMKFCFS